MYGNSYATQMGNPPTAFLPQLALVTGIRTIEGMSQPGGIYPIRPWLKSMFVGWGRVGYN
jgi:hypothetical protein